MASAPGSSRRPRTLRRVVRRLIGGARSSAGPSTSADLVGALPVRRAWPLIRWWQRMLRRASIGRSGGAAATAPPERAPLAARPRPLAQARRPLVPGRDRGPEVRPGHELVDRPAAMLTRDNRIVGPARRTAPGITAPPGTGPAGRVRGATSPAPAAPALVARPAPGPSVSNPQPVGHLRVLGAAPMPPGSEPDPAGAVTFHPPAAGSRGARTGLGRGVGPGADPGPGTGPGARAGSGLRAGAGSGVGAGPGLAPGFGPAAAVRPGPATRPGGLGVTSSPPVPHGGPRERWEAAVAARPLETPRPLPASLHAMAAAISGRARPPLFTTGPATRHALAAAGALGATTGTVVHLPAAPAPGPSVSAVLAHELTHTRNPVRRPRFFLGGASSLLDDDERSALAAGRTALQSAGAAATGMIDRGRAAAGGLVGQGRAALADAGSTAAGIVDSLPVGGGLGAVGDMATRAARAAVLEAAAAPMSAASGLADRAGGLADQAGGLVSGVTDRAAAMADTAADTAAGYADRAADAVGGVAARATGAVATATGAAKSALDPDKVVEIVEQRLLREIERRGGRWAGVF